MSASHITRCFRDLHRRHPHHLAVLIEFEAGVRQIFLKIGEDALRCRVTNVKEGEVKRDDDDSDENGADDARNRKPKGKLAFGFGSFHVIGVGGVT